MKNVITRLFRKSANMSIHWTATISCATTTTLTETDLVNTPLLSMIMLPVSIVLPAHCPASIPMIPCDAISALTVGMEKPSSLATMA